MGNASRVADGDGRRRREQPLAAVDQGIVDMTGVPALDELVAARLGGDESRLMELFETREVFDALRADARQSDFFRFKPCTYDGRYLVEQSGGFEVYLQERGIRCDVYWFASLRSAAQALFG